MSIEITENRNILLFVSICEEYGANSAYFEGPSNESSSSSSGATKQKDWMSYSIKETSSKSRQNSGKCLFGRMSCMRSNTDTSSSSESSFDEESMAGLSRYPSRASSTSSLSKCSNNTTYTASSYLSPSQSDRTVSNSSREFSYSSNGTRSSNRYQQETFQSHSIYINTLYASDSDDSIRSSFDGIYSRKK